VRRLLLLHVTSTTQVHIIESDLQLICIISNILSQWSPRREYEVNTSFVRVRNSAAIVALAAAAVGAAGIAPAQAVGFVPPVSISTAPSTAGHGQLTVTSVVSGPVTVTPEIDGGLFVESGGVSQQVTVPGGGAVTVDYTCTGPTTTVFLGFPVKGSPVLNQVALCGEEASWVQAAEIALGPDGSGNADVLFDNTSSNRDGSFYVTLGGGEPTSVTSVVAGQTKSIPIHAAPGTVVRVYGTQDGNGAPQLLATQILPELAAPPEASWDLKATIALGPDGSGNATVTYDNGGSNRDAAFFVTINNGEPTASKVVSAHQAWFTGIHANPGDVIRVFGSADGTTEVKQLAQETLPKAPATPTPPDTTTPVDGPVVPGPVAAPVVPAAPVAPAASNTPPATQPDVVVNAVPLTRADVDTSTPVDEDRFSFDTAATSQGTSPQVVVGFGIAAVAAIFMVGFVVFGRRRA
jgi:hypothetical protein